MPIFALENDDVETTIAPRFETALTISNNSIEHAHKVAASFGVEGSYGAFSGSASASLEAAGGSEKSTMRCNHDLFFYKSKSSLSILDYADHLRPQVVKFVKRKSAEQIVRKLGQFFATEISFGGQMRVARMIEAKKSDTSRSMHAEVQASYGKALFSASASASASASNKEIVSNRKENVNISVRGGDMRHWAAFNGNNHGECQSKWAASITDEELYPVEVNICPLWELFEDSDDKALVSKAHEIEAYLTRTWKDALDMHRDRIRQTNKDTFDLVTWVASNRWAGNDAGSGADADLNYWLPSSGYTGFGHAGRKTLVPAVKDSNVEAAKKAGVVADCLDYECVWTDRGSGNSHDYAVYVPIAPPGFVPLGAVCVMDTSGVKRPSHKVLCVSTSHPQVKEFSGRGSWAWSDGGTGASYDLGLVNLPQNLLWPNRLTMVSVIPKSFQLSR